VGEKPPNKLGTPTGRAFFNRVFDTALSLAFQALLNRRFRPNRLAGLYPKNLWNRPLVTSDFTTSILNLSKPVLSLPKGMRVCKSRTLRRAQDAQVFLPREVSSQSTRNNSEPTRIITPMNMKA
jgi:hypothetical protein